MSAEILQFVPERRIFTKENQVILKNFLHNVHTQLDNATEEIENNDGRLRLPISDSNVYACKWNAPLPELPQPIRSFLPFESGEYVNVHARHRYGTNSQMVNIWISSPNYIDNESTDKRTFALGFSTDIPSGEVDEWMFNAGSDQLGEIKIDESDTRKAINAIFAENTIYNEVAPDLNTVDAFRLGIATQPDNGGRIYTWEGASKNRSSSYMYAHFDLTVDVFNRLHPQGENSETRIELTRHFRSSDFPEANIFPGCVIQKLTLLEAEDGEIVDAFRNSQVDFFSDLKPITLNGEDSWWAGNKEATEDAIPHELKDFLYTDTIPTKDTLDYFNRLLMNPIEDNDVFLTDSHYL